MIQLQQESNICKLKPQKEVSCCQPESKDFEMIAFHERMNWDELTTLQHHDFATRVMNFNKVCTLGIYNLKTMTYSQEQSCGIVHVGKIGKP